MKGYKLTNPDNTVYGIFNDKDMATKCANRALMTYGFIPKLEEVVMPEITNVTYNLKAQGREWDFESASIEQLKIDAENYAERNNVDLNDSEAESIAFGYDKDDNEVFIVEAL